MNFFTTLSIYIFKVLKAVLTIIYYILADFFTLRNIILTFMVYSFIHMIIFTKDHHYDFLIHYHDSIETLSFSAVIISTIFVAWQIKFAISSYIDKNRKEEESKSYELAKFYGQKLLPRLEAVNTFINIINMQVIPEINNKQSKTMPKKYVSKMRKFNRDEAYIIFKPTVCNKFIMLLKKSTHSLILRQKDILLIHSLIKGESPLQIRCQWNRYLKKASPRAINDFYKYQQNVIISYVAEYLNDIEYFAMVSTSHLAMPKTVFDSLHQTYLSSIQNLYLYIAMHNYNKGHDFYTYTIKLYNAWNHDSFNRDKDYFLTKLKEFTIKLLISLFNMIIINALNKAKKRVLDTLLEYRHKYLLVRQFIRLFITFSRLFFRIIRRSEDS